jgi:hypothetical protein
MSNVRSDRHRALDSFALLALVITFLLRHAPFLESHLLFGPFADNVHMYAPIFSEVSRLSLSGEVPYYLPDIGAGFPVFESPHFSILYPFYFFGLLNYGGPLDSVYTLTHLTLLHIFIFYVNLYVLLRCSTVPPWAAYIGASVGMLARNTQLYATWVTITASYAWLPLVVAGGVLLLRFPGKARGIFVFSTAAALLALASASQPVIHAALSCLILFAAGTVWFSLQRRFGDILRLAWSLALCSAIAFGLAGAAILPMYLATSAMIRHIGGNAAVIGHAHIPWENFNLHQLTLDQAIGVIVRPTWINVVGSPYVGPLAVTGTFLTLIYFRRLDAFTRTLAIAFAVLALYGLLSSFGTNLGLAYINFHLPFINRIREAGRHLILFIIGVSFLSGLGFSLLSQSFKRYEHSHEVRALILPAILALIFAGIILWELWDFGYSRLPTRFWIVGLAPLVFALGRVCRLPSYGNLVLAAGLVSAAAMIVPMWNAVSASRSDFVKPMNLLSHCIIRELIPKIDAKDYRVDFRDASFPRAFWAMNASYYGIKSFYNQLTPQPLDQFRFSTLGNVPHLREMMGARYVLCGPNDSPTDMDAKQIFETAGYRLYENPKPMGRLALVHRVARLNNNKFINIVRKDFDYFSEAYLTPAHFNAARQSLGEAQRPSYSEDRITNTVNQPNRSYSTVQSDSASLLILNEWFTPAWKARVNGKKQSVLRVNQWQTGLLLGAGKNRVEFEYRPTLFRILMILNRITIVLLLFCGAIAIIRQARAGWHRQSLRTGLAAR